MLGECYSAEKRSDLAVVEYRYITNTGNFTALATQRKVRKKLAEEYLKLGQIDESQKEFILLNTAIRKYTHTQFQDVYGPIPPTVWINPQDAHTHLIQDNDIVKLYNDLGSIKLKAIISSSILKGVLWTPRQGNDLNGIPQVSITPSTTQQLGGGPIFNTTIVKIQRSQ